MDCVALDQQLHQRLDMAMALLHPPQQQQQQTKWFFFDLEDDGGFYEVEVDMVGLCLYPLSSGCQEQKLGMSLL